MSTEKNMAPESRDAKPSYNDAEVRSIVGQLRPFVLCHRCPTSAGNAPGGIPRMIILGDIGRMSTSLGK